MYRYIPNLYFDDYWLTTGHYVCRRNEPPAISLSLHQ